MDPLILSIAEAEAAARPLEPDRRQREAWLGSAARLAGERLDRLDEHPTYVPGEPVEEIRRWPISEQGRTFDEVLRIFSTVVLENGIDAASGGHLGYIPGGGLQASALGDYLAAVTNRYAGLHYAAPGAVQMENMLIEWIRDLVGYPASTAGYLASGGSLASLSAIVTARDARASRGERIARSVIYGSAHMHHCLRKAIRIAGLAEAVRRDIALDERHSMDPAALRECIRHDRAQGLEPALIIGSAGTTDTGAIDPLDALADLAAEHGAWFHVDAAYGGFFMLLDELRERFSGIERSDSLVIDPHKSLFLPSGTGALLVRDGRLLLDAHHYTANYMQDAWHSGDELSPADLSPELTRHYRGLRMWLPLMLHGTAPFKACLREKLLLTRYFRMRMRELPGFILGPEPDLSVTFYRLDTRDPALADVANHRLAEAIRADGRLFVSTSVIDGRVFIRLATLSFRTHRRHIDLLLELLREKGREIAARYPLRGAPERTPSPDA
ncbi:MAG: aminotransferase class V-fold PLP-dependent enzyme [Sphingobacteriia bacterium]|nr:aminotransferase class V-fold PLP-dependent enzyme [Sphingobacteriia bacterium]NCC37883.1 aminotransferase class V-fold PLP-dependent enzyme [Gammaproteobacteria bacterium]